MLSGNFMAFRYTGERMKISIKVFASLRDFMDPSLELRFPAGSTIETLLNELCRRYPPLYTAVFQSPGVVREFVNILKNGRDIHFLEDLATPLNDGDVIAIFPPVSGG